MPFGEVERVAGQPPAVLDAVLGTGPVHVTAPSGQLVGRLHFPAGRT
jgi:hypothetical protein